MFYKKWTKDPWCEENKAIVLLKVSCTRTQSCININFYKYEHVYNINLPATGKRQLLFNFESGHNYNELYASWVDMPVVQ